MRTKIFLHLDLFYEANPEINLNEIYLLSWFREFKESGKLKDYSYTTNGVKEEGFYWFSYPYFLKENPFFNIQSRKGLFNLIRSIEQKGFIDIPSQKIHKDWMKTNRKLLIRPTEITEEIFEKIQLRYTKQDDDF